MTADKASFIEAFFDDLRRRIDFAKELHDQGHDNEGMLLSCCYIDGLANQLYAEDDGSHRNFVRAIREYGGADWLTLVHPRQLRESLERLNGDRAASCVAVIKKIPISQPFELPDADGMLGLMSSALTAELKEWLRGHLWRGTLASIVYSRLRVPAVHGLGAPAAISFDDSRINGARVPTIDFDLIRTVTERICMAARGLSTETGKWFGRW
jgi:hypothetical protein